MPTITNEFPQAMTLSRDGVTVHGGAPSILIDLATLKRHPLLTGSASKLLWAHGNVTALSERIRETFADYADQPVLGAYLDEASGYHVFRVTELPDLADFAENFSHAVADVTQQIRNALDQLAWKCACKFANGTPKNPSAVKFPICNTATDWQRADRAWKQLERAHCAFVASVQPYQRDLLLEDDSYTGRYVHPLTLLQRLSNDDKHRETTPALLTQGAFSFRKGITFARKTDANGWEHLDIEQTGIGVPMKFGGEVMRARLLDPPGAKLDDAGRIDPTVEIGEGRVADHTMRRLHRSVHFILSEFARQFP
jgi:hypothetical protein